MTRREYRRIPAYPASLSVAVTADMKADVAAVAHRAGLPVNEVVRQAIAKGLPAVRSNLRPSRWPNARPSARREAAK